MSYFRADRFASLYLVRPLRRFAGGCNPQRIPILMYHSISEDFAGCGHPYFVTETSPQIFETHMRHLRDNRYCAISLDEVTSRTADNGCSNGKRVAITFDDGYRDFYTRAFPVLRKYGLSATVYLPSAYISHQHRSFRGKDCLTWAEVRELHNAGISFGSHTMTHRQLKSLSGPDLEREIRGSKDAIENELGVSIRSFAYPYAFPGADHEFRVRLQNLLERAGYENGVSTSIGSVHHVEDRFFLKRLPANVWDDLELFQAKLEGNYDWLYPAQFFAKWVKSRRN